MSTMSSVTPPLVQPCQINANGYFVDMLDERGIPGNERDPNTGRPNYEPFFGLSDDEVCGLLRCCMNCYIRWVFWARTRVIQAR